jgi:hypothetical protein
LLVFIRGEDFDHVLCLRVLCLRRMARGGPRVVGPPKRSIMEAAETRFWVR